MNSVMCYLTISHQYIELLFKIKMSLPYVVVHSRSPESICTHTVKSIRVTNLIYSIFYCHPIGLLSTYQYCFGIFCNLISLLYIYFLLSLSLI